MQPPPTIYVDFDDCICETARAFTGLAERHFGRRVAYEDIASFDLDQAFGLTATQHADLMRLGHEPTLLASLEPVPGAIATLTTWRERGYAICIATGRPPAAANISQDWLSRHGVPCTTILYVDKYGRHEGDRPDAPPALSLDALCRHTFCLAIEDAPVMIDVLVNRMPMPVAVLDRPWNRRYALVGTRNAAGRARRYPDWPTILSTFPNP